MKRIAIIGAGISGLTTAKAFMERGHDVTVFEKASDLGGVWEKSRSYIGVATQTTRDEYAFSDFPMPKEYSLWPTGAQVQQYLKDYAKQFDLLRHICFNTSVTSLQHQDNIWKLTFSQDINERDHMLHFDFVAICTGTFHKPFLPRFQGAESFLRNGGRIFHSSEVKDESLLIGKHVAVVGFAKSATDIATQAADLGKSCTLLYRKAQWKVPRYFANKLNMRLLLFCRLSEAFFSAPRKTLGEKILHSIGRPIVWAQWRGLEMLLKNQFKLKKCNLIPSHRIEDQISCSLGVAPEGFYEKIASGTIQALQTEISHFNGREVVLTDGSVINPDVIVCGTGFRQELPFLEPRFTRRIVGSKGYNLYRNIIHPEVPQLGFVGYNSSLFTTLTSEIAANWLASYADGELNLPSAEAIQADMDYMQNWRSKTRPIAGEFSGTCVAPFNYMHLDMLMKDMGLKTKTGKGLMSYLKPINPADYHKLLKRKERGLVIKGDTRIVKKLITPSGRQLAETSSK